MYSSLSQPHTRRVMSSTVAGVTRSPYVRSRDSQTFLWCSRSLYFIKVAWTRTFLPNLPRGGQSGEKTRIGGLGGPGNRRIRWLMIQCAHVARKHDPRLRRLYERHARRKGKKNAVAVVAHEMVRIIFFMLKRGEPYREVNRGLWERKLLVPLAQNSPPEL